jgi:hypothetical protein
MSCCRCLVTSSVASASSGQRAILGAFRIPEIAWKSLSGLELTDPGFDHAVLCEFRTAATHVLAAIRVLNRLELVGKTMKGGPERLGGRGALALSEEYRRYSRREDSRLPQSKAHREAYAQPSRLGRRGVVSWMLWRRPRRPTGYLRH